MNGLGNVKILIWSAWQRTGPKLGWAWYYLYIYIFLFVFYEAHQNEKGSSLILVLWNAYFAYTWSSLNQQASGGL